MPRGRPRPPTSSRHKASRLRPPTAPRNHSRPPTASSRSSSRPTTSRPTRSSRHTTSRPISSRSSSRPTTSRPISSRSSSRPTTSRPIRSRPTPAGLPAAGLPAAGAAAGYPQQPYYDQQAYAQQQQAYAQQQQAYAQQQWQQPGQPYYDQGAYGQQPSYYDQQAYAQQQWQQGYQQPGQPYAYAQPGQQPWPAADQYWDQAATGYNRSFMVVLAAFALLTWGLVFGVGGALVMWLGNLDEIVANLTLSTETLDLVEEFNRQANAFGAILLILGIMQTIGSVGILAHRAWGRAFGVVLGLLGTIWGIGLLLSAVRLDVGDFQIEGALAGEQSALGASLIVLVSYALVFVSMFVGRRHFRRKGVS